MISIKEQIRSLGLMIVYRYFIIYSVLGWILETTYCFLTTGHLTKRGFFFGPLCPIYGFSILIMLLICSEKNKNMIYTMVKCALVATAMEYVTSYWLEHLFNRRWWDYSNMFLNLNGRICIGASLLFGILGGFFIRYIHPQIVDLVNRIPKTFIKVTDKVVLIIFLYDMILSFRANLS